MFFRSFHSLSPKRRLMGRFAKVAWVLKIASVSLLPAAVTSAALSTKAQAQTGKIGDALDSLGITLPDEVLRTDSLRQPLDELARERCDGVAIASLGDALEKIGRRREAAIAQIAFSRNCDGHASAVRRAVNILLALNDPAAVVSAASRTHQARAIWRQRLLPACARPPPRRQLSESDRRLRDGHRIVR